MFSGFLVTITPLILWKSYFNWRYFKRRLFWLSMLVSAVMFILMSYTRTSMLAILSVFLCFFLSLQLSKKVTLFLTLFIVFLGIITFKPDYVAETIERYFLKGFSYKQGLLYSRKGPWQASYEGAVAGGMFGLGYGASYLYENFDFHRGLTALAYGREKGNSQLAVLEEIGVVGFILYLGILSILLWKIVILYMTAPNLEFRVLIGLVAGAFFSRLVESFFEGWWVSPSSPENVYFWTLVGVIRGLELVNRATRFNKINSY